jgi:hypothetical protein
VTDKGLTLHCLKGLKKGRAKSMQERYEDLKIWRCVNVSFPQIQTRAEKSKIVDHLFILPFLQNNIGN